MDSDLTLVNVPPPTAYFLSSVNLKDATIYAKPGVPLYRVTSDTKHVKIYDGTIPNRIIAVLHRRELFSDTICFPHRPSNSGTQLSLQRWFKRFKVRDGTLAFMVDTDYGPYVWKSVSRYRQKVYADYDMEKPVASCYLHHSLPPGKPALVVQSAGEPLRDDIVVAYLLQRHRLTLETKALDLFVGPN